MRTALIGFGVAMILAAGPASGAVIGFEDLTPGPPNTGQSSFNLLGVINSYQGFGWGSARAGGWNSRRFIATDEGWGISSANPPENHNPSGITGNVYAWTYHGVQSLWIDFRGVQSVNSVELSQLNPPSANTVQAFGYDALGNEIMSSGIFSLTTTFQRFSLGFSGVSFLELRSDRNNSWFAVDQLDIGSSGPGPNPVPEPGMLGLFGLGALAVASARRKTGH